MRKNLFRLAAFELLSVLAHHLSGKIDIIMKIVKEQDDNAFTGLVAAVKVCR